MDRASDAATSPSLLARLRQAPADQTAWRQFVERYGGQIYGWCRHWKLQESDALDVTQNVLLKLAEKMKSFTYDRSGSFRGWLKTLAHHAWRDFLSSRQRPGGGTGDTDVLQWLETIEARDDFVKQLEEEFDKELLDEAMMRVQLRIQAHTWEAFRLTALDGLSGAEAATKFGMKVATVFVAKSKVQKMIQQEVLKLEDPGSEGAP